VIVSASVIRKKHVRGTKKQHLNVLIYKYLILIILGGVVVKKMDKKVLRGLLILVVCVVFVASVVSVFVLQSEVLIGILYGAAGVGLFMLLAKVLTLIQKEGKQDD
jgi:FtsH-binding integral membrane protein